MFERTRTAIAVDQSTRSDPDTFRAELAPDLLLPAQFNAGVRNDASVRPDKRLMLAVLEAAVADFQRYITAPGRDGQRLFSEAETWFESEDTAWPYSFVNSCQALGLEVTYLRAGLRRWAHQARTRALSDERVMRLQLRRRVAGPRRQATGRARADRIRYRR
jgi:hypothetical protein